MSDPRRVVWCGSTPKMCDHCKAGLRTVFIDGRTKFGPWAMLCNNCHRSIGVGLGIGRGQKYRLEPETGQWVKQPYPKPKGTK